MAKDPAFLFYYQDFLVGTRFLSLAEIGSYILILCHMADKGALGEKEIMDLCCGEFSNKLRSKFYQKKDGTFYNKRLEFEVLKRRNYSKSRSSNRLSSKNKQNTSSTYVPHMENENVNVNENKDVNETKLKAFNFEAIWAKYPNKAGRKAAIKHFNSTVKTDADYQLCLIALEKYLMHLTINDWKKPQNGSTWFNSWADWVGWIEPEAKKGKVKDGLDSFEVSQKIESSLGRIATKEMIKKVMSEIHENFWWKVDAYLKKRYPEGGNGFIEAERELIREKQTGDE